MKIIYSILIAVFLFSCFEPKKQLRHICDNECINTISNNAFIVNTFTQSEEAYELTIEFCNKLSSIYECIDTSNGNGFAPAGYLDRGNK